MIRPTDEAQTIARIGGPCRGCNAATQSEACAPRAPIFRLERNALSGLAQFLTLLTLFSHPEPGSTNAEITAHPQDRTGDHGDRRELGGIDHALDQEPWTNR